jgi:hypothetical protein
VRWSADRQCRYCSDVVRFMTSRANSRGTQYTAHGPRLVRSANTFRYPAPTRLPHCFKIMANLAEKLSGTDTQPAAIYVHCKHYTNCRLLDTALVGPVAQSVCNWLRAGRSEDRIPVGARFSAPVQTGPGAHPASCTMGTGSFPGVESGRGVTLTPHPIIVPRSKNTVVLYLYSP